MFDKLKQKFTEWRVQRTAKKRAEEIAHIENHMKKFLLDISMMPPKSANGILIKVRHYEAKKNQNPQTVVDKAKAEAVELLIEEGFKVAEEEKLFWEYVEPIKKEMNDKYQAITEERKARFKLLMARAVELRASARDSKGNA